MESQALAARSCVLVARERSEIWSHDYNGKTLSASLSPSLPALPERSWTDHPSSIRLPVIGQRHLSGGRCRGVGAPAPTAPARRGAGSCKPPITAPEDGNQHQSIQKDRGCLDFHMRGWASGSLTKHPRTSRAECSPSLSVNPYIGLEAGLRLEEGEQRPLVPQMVNS
ncbi:unnamed protein product [Gadus morhua 'NCC']